MHPYLSPLDTKLVILGLRYRNGQTLTVDNVRAAIDVNDDFQSSITCLAVNFQSLFRSIEPHFEEKIPKQCPNLKTQSISALELQFP
jgi:hypothetical protein